MGVKNILFILGATLFLSMPAYADYAYCKTFDKRKITFHYSAVFHTNETHGPTLDIKAGSVFADKYNSYPEGVSPNCYRRNTANEALKVRKADMNNEKRWTKAKVILTTWIPRKESKGIWEDKKNGLVWQDNKDIGTVIRDWREAKNYCSELNHSGYSNWHLPSREQLLSLYSNRSQLKNNLPHRFWSSSEYLSDSSRALGVEFYSANTYDYKKSYITYVRCVRAGQ